MLAQGMESLPRLRQAPAWMRRALLRRKMILCTVQFNFHNPQLHEHEKEQKRLALLELIDYCDNVRGAFNDPSIFHDLMRMIQENLCRSLPIVCFVKLSPSLSFFLSHSLFLSSFSPHLVHSVRPHPPP